MTSKGSIALSCEEIGVKMDETGKNLSLSLEIKN